MLPEVVVPEGYEVNIEQELVYLRQNCGCPLNGVLYRFIHRQKSTIDREECDVFDAVEQLEDQNHLGRRLPSRGRFDGACSIFRKLINIHEDMS